MDNDKNIRNNMKTPPVVSPQEWEAARQQLLVKEKELTRARDAMAAERRRMPWLAVNKKYEFDGPRGKVSLLDLFDGRPQLIVYRAFFEPGVFGWPEHACRGCSMLADQIAHLAHLNARDTTLVFASRAPQTNIARVDACAETRLRVVLHDDTHIDETALRKTGIDAVIKLPGKTLHLLAGLNADQYAAEMRGQLAMPLAA